MDGESSSLMLSISSTQINRDVKPAKLLEPAAVLAHLKGTPFFVLPKATQALGEALGLRRAAALGFKKGCEGGGEEEQEEQEEEAGVRARVDSFLDFVLNKREHMTNPPPPPEKKQSGVL
jgi:hypothetical protein